MPDDKKRRSSWEVARDRFGGARLVFTIIGAIIVLADILVFLVDHVVIPLVVMIVHKEKFQPGFQLIEIGVHALFLLVGIALINIDAARALGDIAKQLPFLRRDK